MGRLRPMLARQLAQHFIRLKSAPPAPLDELGHIHATAADFAAMHPPLAFADPLCKLALRKSRLLP